MNIMRCKCLTEWYVNLNLPQTKMHLTQKKLTKNILTKQNNFGTILFVFGLFSAFLKEWGKLLFHQIHILILTHIE